LILCVLIHSANNLFATVGTYFTDEIVFVDSSLVDYYGGVGPFIIITLTAIIIVLTCIFLLYEEFETREKINWRQSTLGQS